jgi:hypothetical protein
MADLDILSTMNNSRRLKKVKRSSGAGVVRPNGNWTARLAATATSNTFALFDGRQPGITGELIEIGSRLLYAVVITIRRRRYYKQMSILHNVLK